ncbi:hypothetical protein CASFOL_039196 [Castilleja foliolosa]|uniref:Uncharacterized protein n=1 Tax=Castilleja foliolosa TaxID=1961234 RepID=A0ABD3BJ50_9LAMI
MKIFKRIALVLMIISLLITISEARAGGRHGGGGRGRAGSWKVASGAAAEVAAGEIAAAAAGHHAPAPSHSSERRRPATSSFAGCLLFYF